MKVGLRLFLSSGTFGILIAIAYWHVAHGIAGAFLLGFMAFGLSVIACYMIFAERNADLFGDRANATQSDAAGELIGTYTIQSLLPISGAASIACLVLGLIVAPPLTLFGLLGLMLLGALFVERSR